MSDSAWVVAWMQRAQQLIEANHTELTELDREIGDGDHGENMRRGMRAVVDKLTPTELVSQSLQTVAATLMSTVGGAAGPLYGTAFLRASQVVKVPALEPHHIVSILEAMLEGVSARGGAQAGDKTMVDALEPALKYAQTALDQGSGFAEIWQAAAAGAQLGAQATLPMLARKGRASYLGERSQGHRDPGAQSLAYLLAAATPLNDAATPA